jgi:hypothetical protein
VISDSQSNKVRLGQSALEQDQCFTFRDLKPAGVNYVLITILLGNNKNPTLSS